MKQNTTYSSHPTRASKAAHKRAKHQFPTYDTSMIVPKNKKLKPAIIIAIVCVVVLLVIIGVVAFAFPGCSKTLPEGQTAEVTIEEGSSTWTIAGLMQQAGVVDNPTVFTATVTEMGAEASLKPGTYIFEGGKSVREYVQILCNGPDAYSPKVVVTEGMRISSIAKAVEKTTEGRISEQDFVDATNDASKYANDFDFLKEVGKNSLEGFLFPKTYSVSSKDSVTDIVYQMLNQFKKETKDLDLNYPKSCGLSFYDMVILSSIVEKESASGTSKKVASVFYNRINSGMYLNSDATTAYELGHDPTPQEIHANTPYSTYTNYGLPPTPICSPSLEIMEAVCNPDTTNYYFFAFKKNAEGEIEYKFSETFDEHQIALIELGIV